MHCCSVDVTIVPAAECLDSSAVATVQLAHTAAESIHCHEGWWCDLFPNFFIARKQTNHASQGSHTTKDLVTALRLFDIWPFCPHSKSHQMRYPNVTLLYDFDLKPWHSLATRLIIKSNPWKLQKVRQRPTLTLDLWPSVSVLASHRSDPHLQKMRVKASKVNRFERWSGNRRTDTQRQLHYLPR